MTCTDSSHATDSLQIEVDDQHIMTSEGQYRKSLRRRSCVNYSQFDNWSEEESDSELFDQDVHSINSLKKGVIRGCSDCANCQKVLARWHPEDARRPHIEDAPVFYPNEEEFKDTLKYVESIRPRAEPYGICRIVPPPSWKPPCPLKEKAIWEKSNFTTRIQRVDMLQNRPSIRQMSRCRSHMRKRRRLLKTGSEPKNSYEDFVKTNEPCHYNNAENFGFEPGPDFTLESFQKYADDFKRQYFHATDGISDKNFNQDLPRRQWEPSVEDIEGEYWRMVEKPTEEIEVLYGADLETGDFGSGFPKASSVPDRDNSEEEYVKSGWNLNNFPRLPGSVLSFESEDISGVVVPWLYIGMCFSSFCWHVEDHYFYSLNYMHWGAPKMWYGVPSKEAPRLEAAMKKHLPHLFEEQPNLLHNLVTQFSPSMLKSEGVPVYRCVQNSGEFVITFPRSYHSGFNCGFNCAEAVNAAPIDWLPHGQNAVEIYRDQGRKISVSHDKLLLGAAREAVRAHWEFSFLRKTTPNTLLWKDVCGQDKILVKALKARVQMECTRREHFCGSSQSRKMDASFDANGEKECFICHYDLHLSAASCSCSSDKFACLNHAKQMCSCDCSMRFFLFRYETGELNILVDALGGKLSAVHKWGVSDLGLSLSSHFNKNKPQERAPARESPSEIKQQQTLNGDQTGNLKGKPDTAVNGNKSCIIQGNSLYDKGIENQAFQPKKECSVSVLSSSADRLLSREDTLNREVKKCFCEGKNSGEKTMLVKDVSLPTDSDKEETLSSKQDHDIMHLGVKECKKPLQLLADKKNGDPTKKCSEVFARLTSSEDKVTYCGYKDQVPDIRETNASFISEGDLDLLPIMKDIGHQSAVKEETKDDILTENKYMSSDQRPSAAFSMSKFHNMNSAKTVAESVPKLLVSNELGDCNISNNGNKSNNSSHQYGSVKSEDGHEDGKLMLDSVRRQTDRGQSVKPNQSCLTNNVDRHNWQKGPRMAKVVRRIFCSVEALELGVVLSGILWSTNQAIFPKGYRSRVSYLSILDPGQMCCYISEILDAGLHGPLFMVKVEHCPSEVFIHKSPSKCWDMVRERVNYEIRRQHDLGNPVATPMQPPGSVDGLKMFGLTSPTIVQAIEAIDHHHICSEYWKSRPQNQKPATLSGDLGLKVKEEPSVHDQPSLPDSSVILKAFFQKANMEELHMFRCMLSNDGPSSNHEIIRLLNEEMKKQPNSSVF